ncbi:hypothetical protein ABXS75_00405 [Roseburia hominis]
MQDLGKERESFWKTEPKKVPDSVKRLQEMVREQIACKEEMVPAALDDCLWEVIELYKGTPFMTAKKLEFSYSIRGHEMFVTRKDKSITKATVFLAFHKAIELQQKQVDITGPKKLGTFGASYLYPIFLEIGIIWCNQQISLELS